VRLLDWPERGEALKDQFINDPETSLSFGVILPSQYYDRGLSETHDEGIRRLLIAILEDAVRTFQSDHSMKSSMKRHRLAIQEAETWIVDDTDNYPLSFVNVCESLGIDSDALRKGLLNWRRRCLDGAPFKKLPRRTGVRVEGHITSQCKRKRRYL
jgi:hypothetical protein